MVARNVGGRRDVIAEANLSTDYGGRGQKSCNYRALSL
jgi:hypothetical protein